MKLFLKIILLALIFSKNVEAQSFKLIPLDSGKNTSIRGLSVVNDKVAWVSGSNGWVAKTINGKTFEWKQIEGFENSDFRDIEAFSAQKAITISAGSPAYVLKTIDGGVSWKKVYENNDTAIFLDGMDFWNKKQGIIFGDPMNHYMQILVTKNGGDTWENISAKAKIELMEGEAGFAASGTSIRTYKNNVYIATGGKESRLFISKNKGQSWKNEKIPILQGEATMGCFSIAISENKVFAVGGDYLKDQLSTANFFYKNIESSNWELPNKAPKGYKSSIEYFGLNRLVTCGTSGTDYSLDNGKTWQLLNDKDYHVCRKAKKGSLILLAGSKGRISKIIF